MMKFGGGMKMKNKSLIILLPIVATFTFAGCERVEEDLNNKENVIEENMIEQNDGTDINDLNGVNNGSEAGRYNNDDKSNNENKRSNGIEEDAPDTGAGVNNGAGSEEIGPETSE